MSMEMSLDYAWGLGTGYAWGRADKTLNEVAGTIDGITFGNLYREHVAREQNEEILVRWSVQRAYEAWISGEQLP